MYFYLYLLLILSYIFYCYLLFSFFFTFCFFFFFFFFSSRRRHTRSLRDWSSDVCSSDLSTRRSSRCRTPYDEVCCISLSSCLITLCVDDRKFNRHVSSAARPVAAATSRNASTGRARRTDSARST